MGWDHSIKKNCSTFLGRFSGHSFNKERELFYDMTPQFFVPEFSGTIFPGTNFPGIFSPGTIFPVFK